MKFNEHGGFDGSKRTSESMRPPATMKARPMDMKAAALSTDDEEEEVVVTMTSDDDEDLGRRRWTI